MNRANELSLLVLALVGLASAAEKVDLRMPNVEVEAAETYLCHAIPIDRAEEHWIVGYEPHSSMNKAHHMLLFGCDAPGSDEPVWDCGEMQAAPSQLYERKSVCRGGPSILYAWARDAPALDLPEGVGFKVGGGSKTQYLVLQVHYMHPFARDHGDNSGITIHSTATPMPRSAAVMLMATNGYMRARSTENFETACTVDEPVEMHPFAFRTHAHTRGKVVSGWKVTEDRYGLNKWELIGKRDPMDPEMFYDVVDPHMIIREGDVVAARCHMVNKEDRDIAIGATGNDEMCNFYMMYWTDGDNTLTDNECVSPGPPSYYWARQAALNHIPENEANTL